MNRGSIHLVGGLAALALLPSMARAQHGEHPHLHVSDRWSDCAIQLDPSLTQGAWRQFTREAGLAAYFRPLADAQPLGAGNFEVSLLRWETGIDDADSAWNDTFVHPSADHWLMEGARLPFPGVMVRAGVTDRMDLSVYATSNPNANYGFYGGQAQYNLVHDDDRNWAVSARAGFVSLFGPEDVDLTIFGTDLVASRTYTATRRLSVSPYGGVSTYLSRSHEKSAAVNLDDENVAGLRAMVGAVTRVSVATIAFEYSVAEVRSRSFKVGFSF
jgi:hypothetical protein